MNRYQEAAQYMKDAEHIGSVNLEYDRVVVEIYKDGKSWRTGFSYYEIDTADENPLITAIDELIKEVEG